jgi:cytochrome c oxidase subunit II
VIAEPRGSFEAWLANMAKPAAPAVGEQAQTGRLLFTDRGCGGCHQLRGSEAHATVGPDLTHLASRRTIAALTAPDNRPGLEAWLANPQAIKPGNHMPDLGLSHQEVRALTAFLRELR